MTGPGVVERLLAGRIGLDPTAVGQGLIARGVLARMAAIGSRDRADYERALLDRPDELQALVEEVVVPESWFFRDARPFETLREQARAGWVAAPTRAPLGVLSVPCAGGEEPYSIAMTLMEIGLEPGRFRVDGVDVSARSIARAVAGVYGSNSFRGVDEGLRSRYFREAAGAFAVDPSVRPAVRFHIGNLLDPGLLADRPAFDVIFCRNLLIYLDTASRAASFASLARLLVDGGLLFLGHADRADDSPGSPFTPLAEKGSFAYRKGQGGGRVSVQAAAKPGKGGFRAGAPDAAALAPPFKRGGRQTGPTPIGASDAATLTPGPSPRGRGEADSGTRVGALGAASLTAGSSGAGRGALLEEASRLADEGRYDEAARRVERAINLGGAGAGAYFLLGMIGQAAGDRAGAEASFLKAIYLDPQHDEALLAMALLARRRGDVAAEAMYRRRAERVRSRKGAP